MFYSGMHCRVGLVSDKSSVYHCSNSDNCLLCGKNWQCNMYSIASGCVTYGHVTPVYFQFQVNLFHSKHIYLALTHAHDVFFNLKWVLELLGHCDGVCVWPVLDSFNTLPANFMLVPWIIDVCSRPKYEGHPLFVHTCIFLKIVIHLHHEIVFLTVENSICLWKW